MKPRVAINGFGRIGRLALRANLVNELLDIVVINDSQGAESAAHLLKYDSLYGELNADLKVEGDYLIVNGKKILVVSNRDPLALPWQEHQIDVVLECTGAFVDEKSAGQHLTAGAKKVVISAPGTGEMRTICMGVNEETYNKETDHIISNASCTTNCLTPVVKALHESFQIKRGMVSTVHSYTSTQNLVDGNNKDRRRARAAALNFFPNSTGAKEALKVVYPAVAENFTGLSVRVPTPTVSLIDLVVELEKSVTENEINEMFRNYAQTKMAGILAVSDEQLVSSDFKGNPHSAIVDSEYTSVVGGNLVKVLAWYDNEWGYANRLNELAAYVWG